MPTSAPGANLQRRLVAGGTLLIVLVLLSSGWDIWHNRTRLLDNAGRELDNLSRVLASQTASVFSRLDLALRDAATIAAQPEASRAEPLLRRLVEIRRATPTILAIASYDALGSRAESVGDALALPASAADLAFFRSHRDSPDQDLFIGTSAKAMDHDEPLLLVSRRVESADGRFAGVIAAEVDPQHFAHFYQAIGLGKDSLVVLLRRDGPVLARHPAPAVETAEDFEAGGGQISRGAIEAQSPVDHVRRLVALQAVNHFPLVVGVGMAKDTALGPWYQQTLHSVLRSGFLSSFIATLLFLLRRALARREQSEAKLRESEERYALAMAGSNEGHWDWDMEAERFYLSSRMMALLGRPENEQHLGRADLEQLLQVHADDLPRAREMLATHLAGRSPHLECELRLRHAGGEWRWMLVRGLALRDPAGRPYRMSGSIADITERKAAEEERTRLESRLRQAHKMEAVGTMAGGIAHDFNNILGAILGYGEMARGAAADSALKAYLDNVLTAARRAKALVDEILIYSRSQRGRREPVVVSKAVGEALDLVRASLPKNIALERRIEARDATVIGDPTHVHRLAMNLCSNAVQAMHGGGTIAVTVDFADAPVRRVLSHGLLGAGRYVRLRVEDQGHGMAPEVLERIFEPFFTTKPPGSGTGLGLALVHGIVSDMGGAIDVVSIPGAGTRFEIYLPRIDPTGAQAGADRPLPRGEGQRVAFLEDEKALMLLGEEMLAALGYEPAGYMSPAALLEALRAAPTGFDAVVTDQLMPEMSGTDLARQLRALRPDLPVILVSGYRGLLLEQEAAAAGITILLTKPLQARDLAHALAAALHR